MSRNIVTESFKNDILDSFLKDQDVYYMFFGRQYEYPSGIITNISDSVNDTILNPYLDMMFAKKIDISDISKLIKRRDWTSGIVYPQYDHRTPSTNCYVGIQEGSNYYIFKCISNNNDSVSVNPPSYTLLATQQSDTGQISDGYYQTADGYIWRYITSIDSQKLAKFSTQLFIPINNASGPGLTDGSIDFVKVEAAGLGYKNHFKGSFSSTSEIYFAGNTRYFALSSENEVPSSVNGFYTGCYIKILNGSGAGEYREIVDYINSGPARYIVVDKNFNTQLDTTSEYIISPKVVISGESKVKAEAMALIGTSNSIASIEILNPGSGYTQASAEVIVSNVITISNTALLTPIISPPGGHAFNPPEELGSKWLGVSVTLQPDENDQIPQGQQFGQIGILRNPSFENITVDLVKLSDGQEGTDGTFLIGEKIIEFSPIKQHFTVKTQIANNIILANSTVNALSLVYPSNTILLESNNQWFVSSINISQSNSTHLVLDNQLTFDDNTANVYISYSNTSAMVANVGFDRIVVNNLTPFLNVGSSVIGLSSYATGKVEGLIHNGVEIQGFDVVNQLSVLRIENLSGSLDEDDLLISESGDSFYFFGYANSDHIYATRTMGNFEPNTVFQTDNGSTTLTITDKYNGQFKKASGSVLYVENHPLVQRDNNSSQTKRLIIEF